MPRVISFIVLLAIILLVGAIFFQVMAQFIVPLFLASVLLVVFQPLHAWMLRQLPGRPRISAALTTVLILLAVLLPLTWLGWNAYIELRTLFTPTAQAEKVRAGRSLAAIRTGAAADQQPDKVAFTEKLKKVALDLRDNFARTTGIRIDDPEVERFINSAQSFVAAKVISGVQSAIKILIGLAIMVISLYYFLADGPAMIRAVMDLSPLDARYESELLERFGQVSRAVVVATLLSAVVQGALAGIGYSVALPKEAPIFLLTALTMVTALVPFVGAAAVWVCVCGWIYLYGGDVIPGQVTHGKPTTAIILAVYCTIVVSGIDNVIKPFILHGHSKLHPLLALLSILGGVQVLGPVGILVGPMIVSFLQALLNMLRKELDSFARSERDSAPPLAESVVEAIQGVTEDATGATGENDAGQLAATKARPDKAAKPSKAAAAPVPPRRSKRNR